jgi:hypothetical protein
MKPEHKKKLKSFIKSQKGEIKIPFMDTLLNSKKIGEVYQKTIQILPKLLIGSGENEDIEQEMPQFLSRNSKNKMFFRQPDVLASIKEFKPRDLPKTDKSKTAFQVKLPQKDKKSLLMMAKNKQITNKLEETGKNEYVLHMPAYGIGKLLGSVAGSVTNAAIRTGAGAADRALGAVQPFVERAETAVTNGIKQVGAKLNNNVTEAKEPTVTLLSNSATNKEAGVVGETGTPETVVRNAEPGKDAVIPQQSITTGSQTDAPQTQLVEPKQQLKEPPRQNAEQEVEKTNEPEATGSGAKRSGELLGNVLSVASLAIPGLGPLSMVARGSSMLSKLGSVGKMAGMASGLGSVAGAVGPAGGLAASADAGEGQAGALGLANAGMPAGAMGGMMGPAGGMMGNGLALVAGGAGAVGAGMAVSGLAQGAGSAISGVAGAAGGVLSSSINAMSNLGGKLIDGFFGTGSEKKTPPVIVQDNKQNSTTVTNINMQYDIYRKTADDSFMLPNWRREYG